MTTIDTALCYVLLGFIGVVATVVTVAPLVSP
jgi:multisubunit Na+/H+ antiporter MnhF subunit